MAAQSLARETRRGRPPRLSREAILSAAAAMIEQQPDVTFSLNGLARALGVTPMALYTYFDNGNDLLQAVTERLLSGFVVTIPPSATPLATIDLWCRGARDFFLRHPQLMPMLTWEGGGGNTSVAWFDRSLPIVTALEACGLQDDDLARATLWVWSTVMGAIHGEVRSRAAPSSLTPEQVDSLAEPMREPVRRMIALTERPEAHDEFFSYQMERLLGAIEALVARKDEDGGNDGRGFRDAGRQDGGHLRIGHGHFPGLLPGRRNGDAAA